MVHALQCPGQRHHPLHARVVRLGGLGHFLGGDLLPFRNVERSMERSGMFDRAFDPVRTTAGTETVLYSASLAGVYAELKGVWSAPFLPCLSPMLLWPPVFRPPPRALWMR